MSRIDDLKRKLAAREGQSNYQENCVALRAEIARLESGGPLATFVRDNGPEGSDERAE